MKGKYLITTEGWFTAPDGKLYKAIWGDVEIIDDTLLGVKTNRNSTNWYAKVSGEKNHMIVAGCQIFFAIQCDEVPLTDNVGDYSNADGKYIEYVRPTQIWIVP